MRYTVFLFFCSLLWMGCNNQTENGVPMDWPKNMIWYQIFPERFHNGDPSNDPSPEFMKMTYPEELPENWAITPWTQNWYQEDDYMQSWDSLEFNQKLQARRYGGDIQGIIDKLDYLTDLGINGIYLNPVNDAPSLHKYDPRNWRHIDPTFGPDPQGDKKIMDAEVPDDPSTWQWTAADKLFLELISECKKRGIRLIMDYTFNHTGYDFWALNDLRKNGQESAYADWYEVKQWPDEDHDLEVEGWWGFKYLPLLKEAVKNPDERPPHDGNIVSQSLKQHIFNVCQRWLDPDGDGDPTDGVDGYRLDVASEMTLGWWKDFRAFVKSVNPDAFLLAEVWWFDYPDMSGPEKMIGPEAFDAIMNYRWFLLTRGFFSQGEPDLTPSEYVARLREINDSISDENLKMNMNLSATHDTPRLLTTFFNHNFYKEAGNGYKTGKSDQQTVEEVKLFLLYQFMSMGAPQIWNGDELGMWGADDPHCRKPIWWPEMMFEDEGEEPVRADPELLDYYKKLITMRQTLPVLRLGEQKFIVSDDDNNVLGMSRYNDRNEVIGLFNRGKSDVKIEIPARYTSYTSFFGGTKYTAAGNHFPIEIAAGKGVVLIAE